MICSKWTKPQTPNCARVFKLRLSVNRAFLCPRQKDIKKKIRSLKPAPKQGGEKAWEETASKNVSLPCEEVALPNAPCLPVLPAGSSCYASEICFNQRNLNSQFKLSHLLLSLPPLAMSFWSCCLVPLTIITNTNRRDRATRDGLLFFRVSVSVGFSLPFYLPAAVCVR